MLMITCRVWTIIVALLLAPATANAAPTKPGKKVGRPSAAAPRSTPAAAPTGAALSGGGQEALEVRGQTRALSMMLVLRSKKDKVDFVKMRTDYRPEILKTQY